MGSEKMEPFYALNMGNILIFHLKHSDLHFFALTLYNGNFKNIQRKILKVSILRFSAVKLRGAFQTKNVTNCGKSPKGGGVSGKIKIVYISNVD